MTTTRLVVLSAIGTVGLSVPLCGIAQNDTQQARVEMLEQQLLTAQAQVATLESLISTLVTEVANLKQESVDERVFVEPGIEAENGYVDRIMVTGLGLDEREEEVALRPELFVQSRYHANPINEATEDDVTRNFTLSRMEMRWAGRVSDRVGLGYEIQYHPAPDGAAEELVNDAFVEYYPNEAVTFRVGQFIKPFGFDIQHSSSDRESPERGIFAGYFFPGQRDRGAMMTARLDGLARWSSGLTLYAGVFNGNRFFNDYDSDLNYNFRIRKSFDTIPLAIGASVQLGTQLSAPEHGGSVDEDVYGLDVQYVFGRLGIRAEYVHGDMPATLLSLEPEFSSAFFPGATSSGKAAFFNYNLSPRNDIYWRWDRFENDPVTGNDIRAFNVGYMRKINENSRITLDYQMKNDVTFNDDELNTKFSLSWNVEY